VPLRPMNPSTVPSSSVSLAELSRAILRLPILVVEWDAALSTIVLFVLYGGQGRASASAVMDLLAPCETRRSDRPKLFSAIAHRLFQTSFWGPHDPYTPCRK
jgi:hypothetical protein